MNVLSLFDGISCGQLALQRAGIKIDNYFSSEIDKHAIKVAKHHFPDMIELGDVVNVNGKVLPKIDLLIGGSPCQGFSFAGKGLNFNDPRSKLFFEFVRLLEETKPRYFLLENVVMKQEYQDVISQYLGVGPIEINSNLVSAQNRRRLYWTNIPFDMPKDKGILLCDILEEAPFKNAENLNLNEINVGAIRGRYNKATIIGRRLNEKGHREDYNKSLPIVQMLEVRATNTDKSNCLTTVDKDNVLTTLPIGRHADVFKNKLPFRYYTLTEQCRLQTVPDDYFLDDGKLIVSESKAKKMLGNGWTVDVIAEIFRGLKK